MKQSDSFEDHGATAKDNLGSYVFERIEVSCNVDTNTVGTYTVTYYGQR
ncbi:immunoglobulin-like domain-containing protein [Pueribacillus sp. YX66]